MSAVVLQVAEVFGPTFQGEGPNAGRRCAFIRLGECNLHCSWCDTPYTWDWHGMNGRAYDREAEVKTRSVDSVVEDVLKMDRIDRVVITGGEPLMRQNQLAVLIASLTGAGIDAIEIETNGTLAPVPRVVGAGVQFNVSPKLSNNGADGLNKRIKYAALHQLNHVGANFKFVCQTVADLEEVSVVVDEVRIPRTRVWVMPEGTDADTLNTRANELADAVLARRWNMTNRLHVQLWGKERAR